MNSIINFIIYHWYKRKDFKRFHEKNFDFFVKNKTFDVNPKFKNSLNYDSKYLPEENKKFFRDLKENLPHIHTLIELGESVPLYTKKLYYKGYEIQIQHDTLRYFKDIKSIDDYIDKYSVYSITPWRRGTWSGPLGAGCGGLLYDIDKNLIYLQFLSDTVHNHLSPDGKNIGINISELKWIETPSERKSKLRDKKINSLLNDEFRNT